MKTKAFSLDLVKVSAALRNLGFTGEKETDKKTTVRSTVFSLGSDSRISSLQLSTPNLFLIEILKDSLRQLFVRIHWKTPRFDIDSGKIIGFNIYRRRFSTFFDQKLSQNQFSKLSRKGNIFKVKRGMLDLHNLNPHLANQQETTGKGTELSSQIENFVRGFEKIAFVDFTQFVAKEKLKQVFIQNVSDVSIFYDDKKVGFGEEFEYYVSAVSSTLEETFQSDVVKVMIKDNVSISAPSVLVKQTEGNFSNILLTILFKPQEQIDKILIYRRGEEDVTFVKVAELSDVANDFAEFLDEKTLSGKKYVYRVFSENLHGVLSSPQEISVFSSGVSMEKSRSNVLRRPVFNASQQKNIATLTISPNDTKVLFYRIERRDLSIFQRSFAVPSRDTDGYGGSGWATNHLFVDRTNMSPLSFVDDTVSSGHIYQYQISGIDKFGNKTDNSYQTIEILQGDTLKPPINLQIVILREFPLRIKLTWEDNNLDVKDLFEVQRRTGSGGFQSFPLTENTFIVDEVFSDDPVPFVKEKREDIFVPISNKIKVSQNIKIKGGLNEKRGKGVLDFLKENLSYHYRIRVISEQGTSSLFSDEIKFLTVRPLFPPINFSAINDNPKVKPFVVKLVWDVNPESLLPDHFIIERKVDNENDVFSLVGKAYFKNEFFDRDILVGKRYVYRIKSVNVVGEQSNGIETRIFI